MIAGATWTIYVLSAVALLWAMKHTNKAWIDALFVRMAMGLFLAAGFIGANGFIGDIIRKLTVTAQGAAASVGWTLVLGFVALLLGVFMILTALPSTWFSKDPPDWLSMSGLFLPALMASAPGPAGSAVVDILNFWADLAMWPINSLVGIGG